MPDPDPTVSDPALSQTPPTVEQPSSWLHRVAPGASDRSARVNTAAGTAAVWSARLLLLTAAAWLIWQGVSAAWVMVFPAILGLMIATLLAPLAARLRPRWGDARAASFTLLGSLLVMCAGISALAPQVAGQVGPLGQKVADGVGKLRDLAAGKPFYLRESDIGDAVDETVAKVQANAADISGSVLSGVMSVSGMVLNLLLALIVCFYVLKDGHKFLPWMARLCGPVAGPHVRELGGRSWSAVAGFVRAQALVGAFDAVLITIGLLILGVPLAIPLGVLIFFASFIPVFGAVIAGVVAALVALVSGGPATALIVLGIVVVVNQIEGNWLAPKLLGDSLSLHPLIVMGSVTVGTSVAGITGAFLAVPAAALVAMGLRYADEQLPDTPASRVSPAPGEPPATATPSPATAAENSPSRTRTRATKRGDDTAAPTSRASAAPSPAPAPVKPTPRQKPRPKNIRG